uniref:NADH dehydrogenase subunit 6 n=1 Tax=Nylanderia flavipes TaxID=67766 RepID=A0A6B9BQW8_9HYME|nr:NADH dehydrogenase subunit 6 [Nylanderia flavipes]QGW36359.1 NADH dehydrogenase subunit 6 [Nylanderia flavipes]
MNKEFQILSILLMFLLMFLFFFMSMNIKYLHPVTIMMIMLTYSCFICLNMSTWKSNYIYSIMLFLIMISGLLIIFLYFSSLIANEQINFKFNNFLLYSFILNFLILLIYLINSIHFISINQNFSEVSSTNFLNKKIFQNMLNLYEYPMNNLTIITMFYLLLSMFVIIKICSKKSLSLRKVN